MKRPTPLILCLANVADQETYIGAVNAFALDEQGWLTIPYGDSVHSGTDALKPARPGQPAPKPVIQRLTREDAIALVNNFKSGWMRVKRAIVGLPVFKGHPDAPRFTKIWPDKTPRGTIADMEAGQHGLRVKPVLTEQGRGDVDAGDNEASPLWLLRPRGEENGSIIAHPFKLLSLGLVPEGNIQGLSLINAAEPHNENQTMNPFLIQLLAFLGITLAANASEDEAKKAVEQAQSKINSTNSDLATANAKVTTLEGQVATITTAKGTAETALAAANAKITETETKFATERKARALALVNSAITEGRVVAAARDTEVLALVNSADFTVAATALATRPKVVRTESRLNGLSQAAVDSQDRQQQVIALVNAAMEKPTIKALPVDQRYDAAFNQVRKDPANTALFPAKA